MRIIFFCHLISHLWRKMAIVWAIFGMIFRLFTVSDAFMLKKGAHSTWIYLTHVRSRIQAILGPLSHKSMAGRRQKWSILDQKWPNMAGLSTFQRGPKGSKRVQNGQPKCFWPFGTLLGPSGPFWTISDKNEFFAPNGQSRVWRRCFGPKNQFLFEMVQKGPKFQSWPPGWVTLPRCLGMLFCHYQLVSSLYLHQPESHQ